MTTKTMGCKEETPTQFIVLLLCCCKPLSVIRAFIFDILWQRYAGVQCVISNLQFEIR